MASESERSGESLEGLALAESIKAIAAKNARAPLNNEEQVLLFLRSWWSELYNRPLRDPLLLTYTLEDLLYEFYNRSERAAARQEANQQEDTKQEEIKEKVALDWADQMELEELAQIKAKTADEPAKVEDPTKDPENVKWMEEQIKINKEQFGQSFGEDVEIDFNE